MSIQSKLKQSKAIRYLYDSVRLATDFSPDSLQVCIPTASEKNVKRLNLVLLGINTYEVYGGVSTALKVFSKIADIAGCLQRIIVTGNQKLNKDTFIPAGFSITKDSAKELYFVSDGEPLSVSANDIFIFTYWSTWYTLEDALKLRNDIASEEQHDIYLIQDFEPGFFAWSTEYMLAQSTYESHSRSSIALINSSELATYLSNHGFKFYRSHYFEPKINDELLNFIESMPEKSKRNRRIIFYGRPTVKRNAFQLIVSGLRMWSETYPNAEKWEILSLGEHHNNIKLKHNIIMSCGKISLKEYAETMAQSSIGISLMVSPHPSYPPLEMSTFGVKTITNKFEGKNLSKFNRNIISLESCSPNSLLEALCEACDQYENHEGICSLDLNNSYIHGRTFDEAINLVAEECGMR